MPASTAYKVKDKYTAYRGTLVRQLQCRLHICMVAIVKQATKQITRQFIFFCPCKSTLGRSWKRVPIQSVMKRMTIADRAPAICSEEETRTKARWKEIRGNRWDDEYSREKNWRVEQCGVSSELLHDAERSGGNVCVSISTLLHNGPQPINGTSWLAGFSFSYFHSLLANACVCVGGQHESKSIDWVFFLMMPLIRLMLIIAALSMSSTCGFPPQVESNMLMKMILMG